MECSMPPADGHLRQMVLCCSSERASGLSVIVRFSVPGSACRIPMRFVGIGPQAPRAAKMPRQPTAKFERFPAIPLNHRILKKWFAVSPSRILDPLGVAPKAKKNRHSAIHLIQQFLLGQATHLLNQLLDLSLVVLVQVLLINVRRRRISHCVDIDYIEISISGNQLGGTSITE